MAEMIHVHMLEILPRGPFRRRIDQDTHGILSELSKGGASARSVTVCGTRRGDVKLGPAMLDEGRSSHHVDSNFP